MNISNRIITKSFRWLNKIGTGTELLSYDIERTKDRCVHCGVCAMVCPVEAIMIDRSDMHVELTPARCIGCEECVRICPYNAIIISFI